MANKRAKLNSVEQFYIENNPESLSQKELADKFDTTLKIVAGIQQRIREKKVAEQEIAEPAPVVAEPSMMRQTLITKTEGKKKGVVIMTEAASERVDDSAKHTRMLNKGNKYNNGHTTKSYPTE